jgi:hypothetical protein
VNIKQPLYLSTRAVADELNRRGMTMATGNCIVRAVVLALCRSSQLLHKRGVIFQLQRRRPSRCKKSCRPGEPAFSLRM